MSFVDELLEVLNNSRDKDRAALEAERAEIAARLAEVDRKLAGYDQFDRELADLEAQGA
tara:strand:+ start:114 stop:290 length:177 start_codon:yes stop_codon:yes gene_type:complete